MPSVSPSDSTALNRIAPVLNLRAGRWYQPEAEHWDHVFNPSTGEVIAQVPHTTAEETARIVAAAAEAAPRWGRTPVLERARVMFRFRELLERHLEELAQTVTREHGKTLSESRAEVRRGIEVVEFACGLPSLMMGQTLGELATDVDADVMRHPVGVCVGITPYNFPAMVPLWMLPIALTCGNAFVLKPSEKVPLSAVRLGELLLEAGIPEGVFQIVHGGRACVETLLDHPQVAAISFVGSSSVAKTIYQRGTSAGKRVQAAGGAKNLFVVMPDADEAQVLPALATAAFGCSGQRCMSTSIAVPVGRGAEAFVARLCDHARRLSVGPTDQGQTVDVGPLIRPEHVARVASYLDVATSEGAVVQLDGRRELPETGFFLAPSVVDQVELGMRVARDEIFGPVLCVARASDLDAAIELGRQSEYGNGASIFTRDGYAARHFREHFPAGMIGVNVGVPAPMAWFPFSGWNASFFGDLHVQGLEGIQFYTRQKVTLTRWFRSPDDSHHDPVWKGEAKSS